jgi:hypothetical protein
MQRPQSSGIDLAGFSFAKPAANQKTFSLRALPKQGLINLNSTWAAGTTEGQSKDGGQDEQFLAPKNQCVKSICLVDGIADGTLRIVLQGHLPNLSLNLPNALVKTTHHTRSTMSPHGPRGLIMPND